MACKQLSSHCILTRRRERARSGVSSSSYEETKPTTRAPPSKLHLNLNTCQRPHLQMPSCWGLWFPHECSYVENNKSITSTLYCCLFKKRKSSLIKNYYELTSNLHFPVLLILPMSHLFTVPSLPLAQYKHNYKNHGQRI